MTSDESAVTHLQNVLSTEEPKITSSRKQNFLNPSYIFSNTASWNEIVQLTKSIKLNRIFVVKSFESIEEILKSFKVPCESENIFAKNQDQLLDRMIKAGNSIQTDEAKILRIELNGLRAKLLVLHKQLFKA